MRATPPPGPPVPGPEGGPEASLPRAPASPDAGPGAPTRARTLAATAVIAAHFAPPFMFSAVAVVLPALGDDLGASAADLGLCENLFLAGSVALLLPAGRLANHADRPGLYRRGLVLFGLASLAIALTSSVPLLLFLRLVQGTASAILSASGPALLADLVPPARRGRAFGAAIGVAYAGLSLGPLCGGLLAERWGWRAVFIAGAVGLLLAALLLRRTVPSRWRPLPLDGLDLPSVALVAAAILSLVFGTALIGQPAVGAALLLAGLALAALFVARQRRLPRPLLDLAALAANADLRGALAVQALLYMNAYAAHFMLSLHLQIALGRTAASAGRYLAAGSILMTVCAPLAGNLADRLRPARLAAVGVALVLASALVAAGQGAAASDGAVLVVLLLQGLGFALFSSPNMTTIMASVPASHAGDASALGAKSRSLGMIVGMLTSALLLAWHVGDAPVSSAPDHVAAAVEASFTLLAFTSGAALLLGLASARTTRPNSD